ncbi:hypothetical protein KVR01_007525 [Diaporthe batatas]|uniref:uncharacterized protein n=1 Tax=Diaporthe batatas TaxID=748121 RepID=UPI001D053D6D|nr:uncharacterized protein KVR01_007525 [Diaporthe batatas]KAG8163047.1 hypothetical protein KVR01_007525 [Diaporthe batatas]
MMASFIVGLLACSIILYLFKICCVDHLVLSPLRQVPGPAFFAITKWRLAYEDWRGRRTRTIAQLHSRYGPAVRVGPNEVSFNSLSALKTIYGPGSRFGRTSFYRMFEVYGEQNLFTFQSSEEHGARKKLLSHAYSKSAILQDKTTKVVEDMARRYIELLDNEPNGVSDVFLTLHYYSLDSITHFIYGNSGSTSALQGSKSHRGLISDVMHPSRRRLSWCWVHVPSITRWLYSRTGVKAHLVKHVLPMQPPTTYTGIRAFALQAVNQFKLDCQTRKTVGKGSIIEHLWKYHQSELSNGLSVTQVASECADHFLAGIDTTSDTLMFLIWALSLPANWKFQEKLRDELLDIPEESLNHYGHPRTAASDRCTYLQAVIKETLRLYAPLPSSEPRSADATSTVDGYTIPPNTVVSMSPWILHRNSEVFEDPSVFDPERWLGSSENTCLIKFEKFRQ